jgi:hypothetical protein
MPRPGLCREGRNETAQSPMNAGLLNASAVQHAAYSGGLGLELSEEGQQFVVRLKALGSAFDWIGFG